MEANLYANAKYDEMWAITLALNNSLDGLGLVNKYQLANLTVTNNIDQELGKLSFISAGGKVVLKADKEAETLVDILQGRSIAAVLLTLYDSASTQISL